MSDFICLQLANNRELVLNQDHGIVSLLIAGSIVEQVQLAPIETALLQVLLASWPAYATNSVLYAAYHQASETSAQRVILKATEERRLNITLHQIRNIMARIRAKLAILEIGIEAEHGLGYKLVDKRFETSRA